MIDRASDAKFLSGDSTRTSPPALRMASLVVGPMDADGSQSPPSRPATLWTADGLAKAATSTRCAIEGSNRQSLTSYSTGVITSTPASVGAAERDEQGKQTLDPDLVFRLMWCHKARESPDELTYSTRSPGSRAICA